MSSLSLIDKLDALLRAKKYEAYARVFLRAYRQGDDLAKLTLLRLLLAKHIDNSVLFLVVPHI